MANETMNLNTPILTLDSDTVLETAQSKADLIWHDIQNAIVPGKFSPAFWAVLKRPKPAA